MSSDGETLSTNDSCSLHQDQSSITPTVLLETRRQLRRLSNFADLTVTANLQKTKHLNVATVDLNAIDRADSLSTIPITPQRKKSTFPKMLGDLKIFPTSESKVLLGTGTSNRGRFLSLDSSNIFQTRSKNRNRRCSWYGGSIRTSLICTDPKPKTRSSKISVRTLDSDGYPERYGVEKVVRVDVHRSLSGEPAYSATKKSPKLKPKGSPENVIISIDSPQSKVEHSSKDMTQVTIDDIHVYPTDGRKRVLCNGWLRGIDKMTSFCPSCSEQVGPVLITVSLCAGLIIVATVILFFSWIFAKIGSWWA